MTTHDYSIYKGTTDGRKVSITEDGSKGRYARNADCDVSDIVKAAVRNCTASGARRVPAELGSNYSDPLPFVDHHH